MKTKIEGKRSNRRTHQRTDKNGAVRVFFLLFHGNAILGYKFLFNSSSCKITATSRLGRAARYFLFLQTSKKEKQEIPKLCAFHFARVHMLVTQIKIRPYRNVSPCSIFHIRRIRMDARRVCTRTDEYG